MASAAAARPHREAAAEEAGLARVLCNQAQKDVLCADLQQWWWMVRVEGGPRSHSGAGEAGRAKRMQRHWRSAFTCAWQGANDGMRPFRLASVALSRRASSCASITLLIERSCTRRRRQGDEGDESRDRKVDACSGGDIVHPHSHLLNHAQPSADSR